MNKPTPKRRVYKPMRFGEGMQPGTVEWEANQRRLRAERRNEERQWVLLQAKHEAENKTLRGRFASILDRIRIWFRNP